MSNVAAFSSYEASLLRYLFLGGSVGYTGGLPGMTTGPALPGMYLGLCEADPRTSIVYPNAFRDLYTRNATWEPTAGEWDTYSYVIKNRYPTQWEVVDSGGGVWVAKNKTTITFPTPGVNGPDMAYMTFMLPAVSSDNLYLWLVGELSTPYTVTNGVALSIAAGDVVMEAR